MSKFKKGDRVKIIKGVDKGLLGTVMSASVGFSIFVNTDKSNNFNHPQHNGYGLLKNEENLEKITSDSIRWTKKEIDFLHCHYRRRSIQEIADYLGRTYDSVKSKARNEKIHKHPRRNYNDRDNRFIVHTMIDPVFTQVEIGRQLHRSPDSIHGRISLMRSRNEIPEYRKD